MPQTQNYGFDYEEPSSLPGTTLTGGVSGGSPILAVQVDTTMASIEALANATATDVATNTGDIAAVASDVADLTDWTQTGIELVTFSSADNFTQNVSFGFTFPSAPNVFTNIHTGDGSTSRWQSRAISVSTSGFTLFVFASTATDDSSWTDVPVMWTAIYRP